MNFIKSYENDYDIFKKRFKQAGLGSVLDARNTWRYLLGVNKYLKKKALEKLKSGSVQVRDLQTLRLLIKSSYTNMKQ